VVLGAVAVYGVAVLLNRIWSEDDYVDVRNVRISGRVVEGEADLTCVQIVGISPADNRMTGGSSSLTRCARSAERFPVGTEVIGMLAGWCEPHLECDAAWLAIERGDADFLPPPPPSGRRLD
jgi:hypothetical protein